jgi:hypothetical protein
MAVEVMEMAGGSNDRRHEMIQRTQEVVPLTLDLVKEFLAEKDLKYLVDEDGDLVLIFKTPIPRTYSPSLSWTHCKRGSCKS